MKTEPKSPGRLEWERIKAQATIDALAARGARERVWKPSKPKTWRYCGGKA